MVVRHLDKALQACRRAMISLAPVMYERKDRLNYA